MTRVDIHIFLTTEKNLWIFRKCYSRDFYIDIYYMILAQMIHICLSVQKSYFLANTTAILKVLVIQVELRINNWLWCKTSFASMCHQVHILFRPGVKALSLFVDTEEFMMDVMGMERDPNPWQLCLKAWVMISYW